MKKWFLERFLPMWAKQTVLSDNRRLRQENETLQRKLRLLESYTEGLQAGIRATRKVSIYNQGGQK